MAVEKIQVPDLGESSDVEVIEILVKPGDEISENDSLVVLESDKAAMEVPAPKAGIVKEILLKVGDQVSQGAEMLTLEVAQGEAAPAPEEVAEETPKQEEAIPVAAAPEEAPAEAGQAVVREIRVPNLGEDSDVEVIEIQVAEGEEIAEEQGLITLESDKAAMDVPSPAAGKVLSIKLKIGDKVSEGDLILELESVQSVAEKPAAAPAPAAAPEAAKPEEKSAPVAPSAPSTPPQAAADTASSEVYAGPAVRKLARELGVDLSQVTGSGPKQRILKEDVHDFVKARMQGGAAVASGGGFALPAAPDIDFSKFGEIEEVEMSKLHRVTAENMQRCWLTVPHVTQFDEADVTDLEDFRQQQKALAEQKGVKLTPLAFIVKACARALAEYPQFNVSLHASGQKLVQKKYIHIGIAVATPAGLMVPVIRDADRKSIWELAAEVIDLSTKAKDRRLSKEQMEGACFTISSLGGMGGTGFTPIVNSPEVAILGVSRTTVKPVYQDGEFVPRKMMPFSLSYDHRAVNGLDGGLFCTYLAQLLSDIRLMVL